MSDQISISKDTMKDVFNEWVRRYAENPNEFINTLDKDGNPIADYGERCATYFLSLFDEKLAFNLGGSK